MDPRLYSPSFDTANPAFDDPTLHYGPAVVHDRTGEYAFGRELGPMRQVKGLIVHHTGPGLKNVDDVIRTFNATKNPAHFVIDRQGNIFQIIPDGTAGSHVGV